MKFCSCYCGYVSWFAVALDVVQVADKVNARLILPQIHDTLTVL